MASCRVQWREVWAPDSAVKKNRAQTVFKKILIHSSLWRGMSVFKNPRKRSDGRDELFRMIIGYTGVYLCFCCAQTWVNTYICAPESLSQLVCEQEVAEFAVGVNHEQDKKWLPLAYIFVSIDAVKVDVPELVTVSARPPLFQSSSSCRAVIRNGPIWLTPKIIPRSCLISQSQC